MTMSMSVRSMSEMCFVIMNWINDKEQKIRRNGEGEWRGGRLIRFLKDQRKDNNSLMDNSILMDNGILIGNNILMDN